MRKLSFFFILLVFIAGCKKDVNYVSDQSAAIQVINGAINSSIMVKMSDKLNLSGIATSNVSKIGFGTGAFFYADGKSTPVDILNGLDTSLLVSNTFEFKNSGIYTLLVAGTMPAVETVLIEETNYPFVNAMVPAPSIADSVINIRFINLAPDVSSVSVRLQGSTTNEVTDMPYKGYTTFKAYPGRITSYSGTTGISSMAFDFIENGVVLKSFSMAVTPVNRFKNRAIVLTGKKTPGPGEPGLAVTPVNYFH